MKGTSPTSRSGAFGTGAIQQGCQLHAVNGYAGSRRGCEWKRGTRMIDPLTGGGSCLAGPLLTFGGPWMPSSLPCNFP